MAGGITAAVIGGAAVLGGAYMSAQGAQNAANTQANAALQQQGNLLAAGQQASQQFTPYANEGTTALANLASNNAYFNNQFSNADLNAQLAPNYAFMLGQGQQANLMASNATGGVGGNAQKALQDYTQNYASNAYQNAFNNYQAQRTNIYNQNAGLAQLGLAGATGSANAQLGTATNVASLGIGAANAQAASQIAQGNIYGGAANTLGSMGYGYANTLNNQANANYQTGLNNMGGLTADQIATGSTPGGAFTPTAGSSFIVG
jgi:hypothetical protein